MTDPSIPTLEEFEAAQKLLAPVIHHTPVESSSFLSNFIGGRVSLKCEHLQRTGAYKIRGAYNRLSKLTEEERKRGVVAASAGNHAQGVALAARELGIQATIFMPQGAALPKLQATTDYGAQVFLRGNNVEEAVKAALEHTQKHGSVFIPPFDDRDIVTGQGTLGLEVLDELPDITTLVVPIGGGGLISGVAAAVKQRAEKEGKNIRVIGVQSENAAPFLTSLEAGEPIEIDAQPTIADGIAVRKPGIYNFPIVQKYVDEVITVSDDDIAKALLVLLERAKQVVEPAGAVGVAAILANKLPRGGHTAVLLTGGNIDPQLTQQIVRHGLAVSDRYLNFRIPLPDRPGQLTKVSAIIAEQQANVVGALHTRQGSALQIGQVELELNVEVQGSAHKQAVIKALEEAGYEPIVTQSTQAS